MYLKDAGNGKTYLLSTKDGKKYTQKDVKAVVKSFLKKMGKWKKSYAENIWFGNISVLDGEAVLCGSYGEERAFMLTTKDGQKISFYEMPGFEEFSNTAQILKVGSRYVWIRDYVEGQDSLEPVGGVVGERTVMASRYQYYVSEDKKIWNMKRIDIKGYPKASSNEWEMDDYFDAQRKENKYLLLNGVMADGDYLYFGITYRPGSDANEGEVSESYVYRTKDFETYEKVSLSDKPVPEVTKKTAEHTEDLYLTKKDVRYGAVTDGNYNPGSSMSAFSLTRGSSAGDDFKEVFSYDPGKYKSKTLGCLFNWENTGKNVSLIFKREKDNSLFVSKDGQKDFKEYKTSIDPSNCKGIWEDTKKGYKILGYQIYESDGISHLLFSKNGFAKTYRVKLPSGTLGVEIRGDLLLVTACKGNYYVKLSNLYKKMK